MAKKVKDTAYLMLSSMIRAREAGMLTRERMDRMLSAPSFQEAAKLLTDCGYEDMSGCDAAGVDAALSAGGRRCSPRWRTCVPRARSWTYSGPNTIITI